MNNNLPWGIKIPANRQVEGWDAEAWLSEFELAKQHRDTHAVRAEVFQSTVRIAEAGTYVSQNQKLVPLSQDMNHDNHADNQF